MLSGSFLCLEGITMYNLLYFFSGYAIYYYDGCLDKENERYQRWPCKNSPEKVDESDSF